MNRFAAQKWLRYLPFILITLVFILRLTAFNYYKPFAEGVVFETPVGLRLNQDAKGVGTCAGDFPRHFIEQSRCGYFYLFRPGYSAVLWGASRPIVWVGNILPDNLWAKVPLERELLPFAAAVLMAVFLNLAFGFVALIGIKRLFEPYLKNPAPIWLAQMLYATAYGTSYHMADALAEIFQHMLMIWIPLLFRDGRGFPRAIALSLAMTGKEVICCFAGGVISAWKERKLDWKLLLLPLPLASWLLFLRFNHGVAIKSYPVSDWDYGTWYLTALTDFPLFLQKCQHVFGLFFRYIVPTFVPVLWLGLIGIFVFFRRIPLLIHAQLWMSLGQVIAMGYIHQRVLYNFLFMPVIYATVLVIDSLLKRFGGQQDRKIELSGYAAAALGILCVMLVYGI